MTSLSTNNLVSIVAPVYNEADSIVEFIDRLIESTKTLNYDFEFILVDDGSTDSSKELILEKREQDSRVLLVELRKNFGQTPALRAGIDFASGQILVTLDSDLQHFPEELPKFLEQIEDGYDMVCGWRKERKENAIRRWPSKIANLMLRKITALPFHDFGTTYRAYRSEFAKELQLYGEFHRFIPALGSDLGAKITEIPITNIERPKGVSNYGIGRTLGVFLDMFVLLFFVRYIQKPMRIFGKLGLISFIASISIFAVMMFVSAYYDYPVFRMRPGWFTLATMLMLSSLQFFIAGILAEILIRIHFRSDGRSTYQIRNIHSNSDSQNNPSEP